MSVRPRWAAMTGTGLGRQRLAAVGVGGLALVVVLRVAASCLHGAPGSTPGEASPGPPDHTAAAAAARSDAIDVTSGLLVLAGRVGAMELVRHAPDGRPIQVALPGPGVAWVSAGPAGAILATTLDGRAFLGTAGATTGRMTWRTVAPDLGADPSRIHLSFGTVSPGGTEAAFLATGAEPSGASDPSSASVIRLVIATDRAIALPLGGEPTGWPPSWLGHRLIVVRRVAGERVVAAQVTDDRLVPWSASMIPGGDLDVAGIAGSADERVAVILDRGYRSVTIADRAETDATAGSDPVVVRVALEPLVDGSAVASSIALSIDGTRLAVVRADALGNAVLIEIRTAATGWHRVARLTLPTGADRAVVTWAP